MANLYRKYRPKNFSEVFGQNHVKITLTNEIINNSLAQAYLFCGPRAVGKTTIARLLAKSVNCLNRDGAEPCNECENCLSINKGNNLEIIEIDAASHTGVDNVRENIINFSQVPPVKLKYKVFIIDEVHMLSISAFNALLKLIEEPPEQTIFIFCTTEIHKIPKTIVSRCEKFNFRKISLVDTIKKLKFILAGEKIKSDDAVIESIAKQSDGYLRDAESLLGQVLSVKKGNEIKFEDAKLVLPQSNLSQAMEYLKFLNKKETANALRLINTLVNGGIDLKIFNDDLIQLSRKIVIDKIDLTLSQDLGLNFGTTLEKELLEITNVISIKKITNFLEVFLTLKDDLKKASIIQLPFEIVTIKLCLDSDTFKISKNKKEVNRNNFGQNSNISNNNISNNNLSSTGNVFKKEEIKEKNIDKKLVVSCSEEKSGEKVIKKEIKENLEFSNGKINDKSKLKLEDIQEKWKEFLIKIKKHNHSLTFILQNCYPIDFKLGVIKIACKYKFHQERLESAAIKKILCDNCQDVFKDKLAVEVELKPDLKISENANSIESADNQAVNLEPVSKISQNSFNKKEKKIKKEIKEESNSQTFSDLLNTFGGELIN
jgi:DNA polymerase-3 subunit gamma/tau